MDGKRTKYSCHLVDYISHMTDDILISILSHLSLKEAARTSILARRWRYLWQYSVSDLDFEASERIRYYLIECHDRSINAARAGYVRWVNRVFRLHKSMSIRRLRVQFFLDAGYAHDIDAWLQFALAKGVKWLELDLRTSNQFGHLDCYNFPNILDPIEFQRLHLFPSAAPALPDFTPLVTLKLMSVNISGQVLEYFISNCPSLELLCIESSPGLIDLKINGPSIRLKHLEIRYCHKMKNLEIYAPNLVSFVYLESYCAYNEDKIHIAMKNIRQLVKLYFGPICRTVSHEISPFRSCFTQLEELILEADSPQKRDLGLKLDGSPCFPRLRKLVFHARLCGRSKSLLILSSLINAAPNLREFRLELHQKPWVEEQHTFEDEKHEHQCLKEVEIIGFAGGTADVELAKYFLRTCISLEKMVIDPYRTFCKTQSMRDFLDDIEKMMARQRAKELKALSPRTTFVIL